MSEAEVIDGAVDAGWEGVRSAFQANFANGDEVGAGVAVYHRGRKVVDLWGGDFDRSSGSRYTDDALQLVFSTTKGVVAIAVAMCVERGLLRYEDRVSTHWPEFAAHGKGDATVAQLLSHQCGLISVDDPILLKEALDWETVTTCLADTIPDWPIGTAHGYHAITFGWLVGELIRRVDPRGRKPGRFVADEIARPLGLDLWIGLPRRYESRVSPLIGGFVTFSDDPMVQAISDELMDPESRTSRSFTVNGAFEGETTFNRRDVHAAQVPAVNGITNARSLAKLFAATMSPIDGVRLVGDAILDRARTPVTPTGEVDLCLLVTTAYGMGFLTSDPFTVYAGPGSFGHTGAGGSIAFAQPERELAFAYVMNKMADVIGDTRSHGLIDAAVEAADGRS